MTYAAKIRRYMVVLYHPKYIRHQLNRIRDIIIQLLHEDEHMISNIMDWYTYLYEEAFGLA